MKSSLESKFQKTVIAENKDLVQSMLKKENINFNVVNIEGNTVLHFAWSKGSSEILKILLDSKKIDIVKNLDGLYFYERYSIDLICVKKIWSQYKNKDLFKLSLK